MRRDAPPTKPQNPASSAPIRCPLRSALFEEGYHFRSILGENEGLLRLRTGYGGVPGEGLVGPYLLLRPMGRYDLARGVPCHASLMVQLPLLWAAYLSVEALAVLERVRQGSAGAGSLLPHHPEDGLAGFLSPLQLPAWFFEVDHPGDVGVESTALGAHHEHGAALDLFALWDREAVSSDPLVGGRQEHRANEPPTPAGSRQVRGGVSLVGSGFQRTHRFRHGRRGVGSNLPVAFQGLGIQDVTQGSDLAR